MERFRSNQGSVRALIIWTSLTCLASACGRTLADAPPVWDGYAGDPQHTALSSVASQPLETIRWSTPVDLYPQVAGDGDIYIHYGSPMITAANTVIVPVKTGSNSFEVEALNGANGSVLWQQSTNYTLPSNYDWTPSYSPVLTPQDRLYYAGAGGVVYYRDNPDQAGAQPSGQIAFFGNSNYTANPSAYNSSVTITTPITTDASGDIYFGYRVSGSNPLGLTDGIARISSAGVATYMPATSLVPGLSPSSTIGMNSAPAVTADGSKLYVAVSTGPSGYYSTGDLVELNAQTLAPINAVSLVDPHTGNGAIIPDDSTASPMIGPNGDVYMGVLENGFGTNNDRGWMLHFSGDLTSQKTPGAFGWDDTASVVPASMVPSYHGSSSYLIMTKYNNYAGIGNGQGINEIAILDPNSTEVDPFTGATVMKEVLTIEGPTPDYAARAEGYPNAVREWCINSAVVDPATDSVLVNSEDGNLYRWDLATNSFTEVVTLTTGIGEAYTPTVIGADGSVYAIQDATLFNVGEVPEPSGVALAAITLIFLAARRRQPASRNLA